MDDNLEHFPPVYEIAGTNDPFVDLQKLFKLRQRLLDRGIKYNIQTIQGGKHYLIENKTEEVVHFLDSIIK